MQSGHPRDFASLGLSGSFATPLPQLAPWRDVALEEQAAQSAFARTLEGMRSALYFGLLNAGKPSGAIQQSRTLWLQ